MRYMYILLFFCFIFSCIKNKKKNEMIYSPVHVNNKENNKIAYINFESNQHDFGEIENNKTFYKYFVFQNLGKQNLVITNINSSCGCTATEWPKQPIKNMQKDSILIRLNTKNLNGHIQKNITVVSNSYPNTKVLTIKANIK